MTVEPGKVYFIQGLAFQADPGPVGEWLFEEYGTAGPIKIGWSLDVQRRLDILQIGSPVPLVVLAAVPAHDRLDEGRLHRRFQEARLHGEWFRPERVGRMIWAGACGLDDDDETLDLIRHLPALLRDPRVVRELPTQPIAAWTAVLYERHR